MLLVATFGFVVDGVWAVPLGAAVVYPLNVFPPVGFVYVLAKVNVVPSFT